MIEKKMVLHGVDSEKFRDLMLNVDINAIDLRDKFVGDLQCEIDGEGTLIIDTSNCGIELSNIINGNDECGNSRLPRMDDYSCEVDVIYTSVPKEIYSNRYEKTNFSYGSDEEKCLSTSQSLKKTSLMSYAA